MEISSKRIGLVATLGVATLFTGALINPTTASAVKNSPVKSKEIIVSGNTTANLNLRSSNSTSSKILTVLNKKTKISGVLSNNWIKITFGNKVGYIYSGYVNIDNNNKATTSNLSKLNNIVKRRAVATPKVHTKVNKTVKTSDATSSNITPSKNENSLISAARSFLGSKYVWGSADPSKGFDCSGLVYHIYKTIAGIDLNRSSYEQVNNGVSVSKDSLKPGDLLFFNTFGGNRISHVGMYVGNGKMIHASNPKTGVIESDINSSYYTKTFVAARRILK